MELPAKQGLYDPRNEHDACGVGFVAHVKGVKSHDIVRQGLQILVNLDHRGAVGADPLVGDGAGCLIQIPDLLLRHWAEERKLDLPRPGQYAVAMCFLPQDEPSRDFAIGYFEKFLTQEGMRILGWRDVPTDLTGLGKYVIETMPVIRQAIVVPIAPFADQQAFERKILVARKQTLNSRDHQAVAQHLSGLSQFYMPSFSTRTVVYKGLLLAPQVESFYDDLRNPLTQSALALVHQRFSTNTFPSWRLAHPYRFLAHNGEINTVRGNVNWMYARRGSIHSELLGRDLDKMWPLIPHGQSDTACIDNALELLVAGGYSLTHAMMMLIPEAWAGNPLMDPKRRAFYEYYAALMEPWDGPAAIAFTDGRQIGATLDRNGLRPARYLVTNDDVVIMASEAGVLPVPDEKIVRKWRLQPGKMLLIDLEQGRIVEDGEIKQTLAVEHPYEEWLRQTQIKLEELPESAETAKTGLRNDPTALLNDQQAFGYTQEDMQFFLEPMAREGDDPVGSMGTDTPLAVLSDKPKLLYNYFKQNFAQVTNPPIDPIREELVMSLVSMIGPRPNLFGHDAGTHYRLEVSQPILTNVDLEKIRSISESYTAGHAFRTRTIDATWPAEEQGDGLEPALERLCREATEAVRGEYNILIISDRKVSPTRIPIPALLATAAVHHHLIRQGLRTATGLVVETGEAREVHHFCVLAGYGAEAINPYLAFETLEHILVRNKLPLKSEQLYKNYVKACGKGILKVMSKMGISTYQSYCGAQIFDAVGLQSSFVEKYFTGTATTIEGAGLREIAREAVTRHHNAYGDNPLYHEMLDLGGDYAFRLRGEDHAWTPESVARLQHAVRGNLPDEYRAYAQTINDQSERLLTLRGLMNFKFADTPLPLDEVEPAGEIVKRFATGAMSFGSISARGAHHARHRHEPHRRQVQHRRRRRGERPLQAAAQRQFHALGDQAGRVGPLRRHRRISGQCRRAADQDGARRQARRGRPVARAQGRQEHRARAAFDAGRRTDFAAAAPRHLFDRRPGAAHLRPEERQPGRAGVGEARFRGRRRHRRGGRQQGARRSRHDRRLRGRHRRQPSHLADARRLAVGDRPLRDAADPGAERPARPHRGAGRWRFAHRPRRGDRRAARRRRIRLLDRAVDRRRLHHDAQVPSEHLPGRHRDAGPGAARQVHRPARARHQFLLLHRGGSARADGEARLPQIRRHDRPCRQARHAARGRSLEGEGRRPVAHPLSAGTQAGHRDQQLRASGASPRTRDGHEVHRAGAAGAGARSAGA